MRLYIPVETAARELDAKLLLAIFAAERGLDVVLGNRAFLSNAIHRFEPGIFLSHNFDRKRRRLLRIVRDLGHRIVACDEEGLVWLSPEIYRQRRVDPDTVGLIDTIFSWGEQHTRALAPVTNPAGVDVVPAGNPRVDLLRPEMRPLYRDRVAALRRELGPFVLVNSNFGWLNYALARSTPGVSDDDALSALAKRSRHSKGFLKFRLAVFRAFVEVLPRLSAAWPDRTIVVRPHPSEDPSSWDDAACGLDNIRVRYDDELVPWLLGADAIIHNGCTTGIEAALLDRRPIMYRPLDGGRFEIAQPLSVSLEARSPEALIDAVAQRAEAARREDEVARNLRSLVDGLNGALCAARIADTIAARAGAGRIAVPKLQRVKGRARSMVRQFQKSANASKDTSPSHPTYISRKFPRTPVALTRLPQLGTRFG